jgi:hypothetical protein
LATAGDPAASSAVDTAPGPFDRDLHGEAFFDSNAYGPQDGLPTPPATAISTGLAGFDGMSYLDQRLADGGHQPVAPPPDQALCVGNGYVLEGVNVALRVYSTSGTPLTGAVALGPFFGDGHEMISSTVPGIGHSDPACLFDPASGRFVITSMRLQIDPSTGNVVGAPATELAVSRTADPRGAWDIYRLDATADGAHGSPAVPRCPCYDDQPKLGADANGIYIATTLISLADQNSGNGISGDAFFAISKRQLTAGTANQAVVLTLPRAASDQGSFPAHPDPATVPPGGSYDTSNGGTEYLTGNCHPSGLVYVFALTNTSSLDAATPELSLSQQLIATEPTARAGSFEQLDGTRPLASWIQQQTGGQRPPVELPDVGTVCGQVMYADGRLWTAKTTELKPPHGPAVDGIAWLQITPTIDHGQLSATIANQGYVVIDRNSALMSAIAVDRTGHGVMTFDLYGPGYYPSVAYVPIDQHGTGPATIVAQGQVPLDNFDGYSYFGAPDRFARYGDYSAAVTAGDGDFWIANEYMPNIPRTQLLSWGTHITEVHR